VALAWDVALIGMQIVCVPASVVLHDYELTMYPEKLYLLERNRWALLISHFSMSRFVRYLPALLLTELLVWGGCALRGTGFLKAKAGAIGWVVANRRAIGAWRRRVFSRPYDPPSLDSVLRWSYPFHQFLIVASERGVSTRRPPGGLPV
jgi:GT2 family glycosyltransferase